MSEELKPCPFCGSKPRIETGKRGNCQLHGEPFQAVLIRCANVSCQANPRIQAGDIYNGGEPKARQEAIIAWNTRTPQPEQAKPDGDLLTPSEALQKILDALGIHDLNINSSGLFEGYIAKAALATGIPVKE